MTDEMDRLWPHFAPLWRDLRHISLDFLLVGGYGLYLKQQWLLSQVAFLKTPGGDCLVSPGGGRPDSGAVVQTLVPMHLWQEAAPRVTKDLDFVVRLDLIASPEVQDQVDAVLQRNAFVVVPGNARWQFEKKVEVGLIVQVDFHAPQPPESREDLRVGDRRVKPKPSLKNKGIHGREDPEAVGIDLHPFVFETSGLVVVVPNPITWTIMKMVAASEKLERSRNPDKASDGRGREEYHARKHAQDVCRTVAMVTREERDHAVEVLDAVRAEPAYTKAAAAWSELFQSDSMLQST